VLPTPFFASVIRAGVNRQINIIILLMLVSDFVAPEFEASAFGRRAGILFVMFECSPFWHPSLRRSTGVDRGDIEKRSMRAVK